MTVHHVQRDYRVIHATTVWRLDFAFLGAPQAEVDHEAERQKKLSGRSPYAAFLD